MIGVDTPVLLGEKRFKNFENNALNVSMHDLEVERDDGRNCGYYTRNNQITFCLVAHWKVLAGLGSMDCVLNGQSGQQDP